MKTVYTKYNDSSKVEEIIPPIFTHTLDAGGAVVVNYKVVQTWRNIVLLPSKRDDLYQFLVSDSRGEYFILLGEQKGNQF